MKIYVDKVEQSTDPTTGGTYVAMSNTAAPVRIGARFSTPTLFFDGQIDDVRIINKELSQSEINNIYEGATNGSEVGWWPLAEGYGEVAYDVSGNGNHGTITNVTLSSFWAVTQDQFHYNHFKGFSLYEHATTDPINVPYSAAGAALSITPPTGYSKTSDNPAGQQHNGSEAKYSVVPAPALLGKFSHGGNFDGSSNYITFAATEDFTFGDGVNDDPFSFAFWAYVTNHADCRFFEKAQISSNQDEYILYMNSQGRLTFNIIDDLYTTARQGIRINTSWTDLGHLNKWTHVIVTYDGRGGANANLGMNFYINGVLQTTVTDNTGSYVAMQNTSTEMQIGRRIGASAYMSGKLADVRIYNKALSQTEGLDVMDGLVIGGEISRWKINEGAGSAIADDIGSNNGTLQGTTTNFWDTEYNQLLFDASGDADPFGYEDIVANYLGQDRIFADVSVDNQKKELLISSDRLTGSDLTAVEDHINIGP
jgi:hypothetical protein